MYGVPHGQCVVVLVEPADVGGFCEWVAPDDVDDDAVRALGILGNTDIPRASRSAELLDVGVEQFGRLSWPHRQVQPLSDRCVRDANDPRELAGHVRGARLGKTGQDQTTGAAALEPVGSSVPYGSDSKGRSAQ